MKYLHGILVLALLFSACQHRKDDVTSAAMDIYHQYAHHSKTLTVAFVGDYQCDGHIYNTVMFRTSDSTEWEWLKEEFGVFTEEEVQSGAKAPGVITTAGADTSVMPGQQQEVMMGTIMIDSTRDFKDTTEFMAYIDSMVYEMLREKYGDSVAKARKHPMMVMDLDSMPEEMSDDKVYTHKQMAKFTKKHGNVAYFVHVDRKNKTLWLFFQDTSPRSSTK